jgi:PKD repeat protein
MKKLLIILFCLISISLNATIYYVAKTGNNGNPGTIGSPFLTITYGISRLASGDILFVRTGTYNERVTVSGHDGTSGYPTILSAYSGEYPIIDGNGLGTNTLVTLSDDYINFIGFELNNGGASGIVSDGVYNLISHCEVHNCWASGIGVSGDYTIIEYCNVYDCCQNNNHDEGRSDSWGSGISARRYPDYCIIRHCIAHDNWGEGISTFEATHTTIEDNISYNAYTVMIYVSDATDCLVQRNFVYQTKTMGDEHPVGIGHWNETGIPSNARNTFINNIAYGCSRNFYTGGSLDNILVANNTFINSIYGCNIIVAGVGETSNNVNSSYRNNIIVQEDGSYCIWPVEASKLVGITFSNNLYNKSYDSDCIGAGDVISTNHISRSGSYTNTNYYTLSSSSDAIDAGVDISINYDFGENARDANPDIGAYEYLTETSYTLQGQTYTNTNASWDGVDILRDNPTNFSFINNSVTSQNTSGYMLQAGDENGGLSTNNNLDGAIITGNKFVWTGNPVPVSTHGIMLGYNINQIVKYNYFDNTHYSIVFKSDDAYNMTDISGVVAYNIFHGGATNIRIKGFNGVKIYNNTFYSVNSSTLIYIDANTTTPSINTKIKNNIFFTPSGTPVIYLASGCGNGFECDYNIYYCAGSNPVFYVNGSSITWVAWLALGYDTHSVIVNPNFINTTALVPTSRLNYGTNLGSTYQSGLSTSATWVVGSAPSVINQNGSWQIGARLYSASALPNAAFTASATNITAGTTVTFTDQSTGSPTSWYWTFGETPVSTLQNPTHLYNNAGSYTVSLTATNSAGSDVETKINYINVTSYGAHVYYISPTGSDISGSGTIGSPWFTLSHAYAATVPGDIIYVRGGTYIATPQTLSGISGTAGNLISILNYPNETPVFDYSYHSVSGMTCCLRVQNADYIHIKGLRFTNLIQPTNGNGGNGLYGIFINNVDNSTFELCEIDHIGGWGVVIGDGCDDDLFLNCDSHHNADPYSASPWDGSDGFETGSATSTDITFRGCRAWWNCDDGWDLRLACGNYTLENCWAFYNGYEPGTFTPRGNGEAFKLGPKSSSPDVGTVLRTVTNCVAYRNLTTGFSCLRAGYYSFHVVMYNNIAYYNGVTISGNGFYFPTYDFPTVFRNNVDYGNGTAPVIHASHDSQYNSWDGGVTVTDADFASISPTGIDGARQAGSLPDVNFLKLVSGSDLINAGINVGLSYQGSAPDLGAFEFGGTTPALPVVSTNSVYDVTSSTAKSGGYIASGSGIIARGVCWSTTPEPAISKSDNYSSDGTGTGTFVSTITGLTATLTYYIRAYAINSVGTAYGDERSFVAEGGGSEATGNLLKHNMKLVKIGGKLIKH